MDELSLALHTNASACEVFDEQTLMRVLWIHEGESEWAEALADGVDADASSLSATHPKVEGWYFDAAGDNIGGNSYLLVELQRARL